MVINGFNCRVYGKFRPDFALLPYIKPTFRIVLVLIVESMVIFSGPFPGMIIISTFGLNKGEMSNLW